MNTHDALRAENLFPNRVRPIVLVTVLWFLLFVGIGYFWEFLARLLPGRSFQQIWAALALGLFRVAVSSVLLIVAVRIFNRETFGLFGLFDARKDVQFAAGFVMACVAIGLDLAWSFLVDSWRVAGVRSNYPPGEFFYLLATVTLGVVNEELFFRGYLLQAVERVAGTTWAIVLSSVLFALTHLIFQGHGSIGDKISIAFFTLSLGFWFGAGFVASRSLWFPMGLHFGWNLCVGIFLDAPEFGTYAMMSYVRSSFKMPLSFTNAGITAFEIVLTSLMTAFILIYIARQKKHWVKRPVEIRWK